MNKCPRCGSELEWLAGASAHPRNRFCANVEECGWEAWDVLRSTATPPVTDSMVQSALDAEIRKALIESFHSDFAFWSSNAAATVRGKLWPLISDYLATKQR